MSREFDSLYEVKLSRIWQHFNEPGRSAAMAGHSEKENDRRHLLLRSALQPHGFIELAGGYSYQDNPEAIVPEKSFMTGIDKETAISLARSFDQESFIFKDV